MKLRMLTLLAAAALLAPLCAEDSFIPGIQPKAIIEKEGVLNISDGNSIYTFRRDGKFTSAPVNLFGGRTIDGTWRQNKRDGDEIFTIDGIWGWMNGTSELGAPPDERIMKIFISLLSTEQETVGSQKFSVHKSYFVIDKLVKKSVDPDAAADALLAIPDENRAIMQVTPHGDWKNPILHVREDGIFLNDSPNPIPREKVIDALAQLPPASWPDGRVIVITAPWPPTTNEKDEALWRLAIEIKASLMREALLKAYPAPSK